MGKKANNYNKTVKIRLSDNQVKTMEKEAKLSDMTVSEWLRARIDAAPAPTKETP